MIAAILLAAGLSSRTKRFHKLLLPYKGKKLLDHAITAITRSTITYLIIVTGKQQRKIRKIIPKKDMIKVVYNPSIDLAWPLPSRWACSIYRRRLLIFL